MINFLLFFSICIIGCNYTNEEICKCDQKLLSKGHYECYFKNNKVCEKGWLEKDCVKLERFIYYPTGELKEYQFYDIKGELRYLRTYSKNGEITDEDGFFYSCVKLTPTNEIKLGDNLIVDIYIANPPNTEFKVYGIYDDKRYDIYNLSNLHFISKHKIKPEKIGIYAFVFEIDFIDHKTNEIQTIKDDFTVEVM